jgi:D-threo-aldose 1-dehydrogenase
VFRVGREEILAGNGLDFDCFLIAGRYTLLDQSALEEVLRKNISVIIGSPYNIGILVDPGPDSTFDFGPAPPQMIEKAMPLPAAAIHFRSRILPWRRS